MPTECERSETSPNEVQTLQNQPDKQIPQMQQQHEEGGSEGVVVGAGAGGASGSGGEAVDSQIPELTREEKINALEKMEFNKEVQGLNGEMSSSQTSTTSSNNSLNGSIISNGSGKKTSLISPDPTAYVTKARVTRPTPPPPPYNPMQFVQIKPCSLYQTAHQQLKKAEEVKKIKEIKKEEPEDWQNNLDNWKSSRRKRVEHIIDRVVEVKKLELEEHDRTRRKSKTFSEMMEERGERGRGLTKLASLAVYNEDESNDFSDLGIGTSSASGKSSLSEDYDNNSVLSDNNEMDKTTFENKQKLNNSNSTTREYTSSPGYETSSSTAAASSPDPCEYTYEGAIQDYKQRVSRATSNSANNYSKFYGNSNGGTNTNTNLNPIPSKSPFKTSTTMANNELSNPDPDHFNKTNPNDGGYPTRRGSKIEDRLSSFEVTSPSDTQENAETKKVDVPKIDISKRKEIFEQQKQNDVKPLTNGGNGQVPKVALRDRFNFEANNAGNSSAVKQPSPKKDVKRLSGDITSIKERLQSLEQQKNSGSNGTNEMTKSSLNASKVVDIPVPPLKERLSSLQNAVTKEEVKKPPVALVDARQLEIMKNEEEKRMKLIKEQQKDQDKFETQIQSIPKETIKTFIEEEKKASMNVQEAGEKRTKVESDDVDRDDSGIHTADDIDSEERLNEQLETNAEEQLNAAIAALALEEKQLEEAANAVNKIEKEFAELEAPVQIPVKAQHSSVPTPQRQPLIPQQSQPKPQPQAQQQQQQQPQAQLQAQPSLIEMEFSVSPTNKPFNSNTLCSDSTCSPICSSSSHSSDSNPQPGIGVSPVALIDENSNDKKVSVSQDSSVNTLHNPTTTSGLRRKPSNEMIHHRNLLKIFKETFQNDIELDENDEDLTQVKQPNQLSDPLKSSPIDDQKIDSKIKSETSKETPPNPSPIEKSLKNEETIVPKSPGTPTMIPRSINFPTKPPMSPKTQRFTAFHKPPESPITSPLMARKNDSQFSINGRVEIFNSRNLQNDQPSICVNPVKKVSSIPIARTAPNPVNDSHKPIPADRPNRTFSNSSDKDESLATSPSSKPLVTFSCLTPTSPTPKLKNNFNPIQKDSARPTSPTSPGSPTQEIVHCAPPITILDPEELPKPNTVTSLKSCFSKPDTNPEVKPTPLRAPKPLPRSRIPVTPPQSPLAQKKIISRSPPISKAQPDIVLLKVTNKNDEFLPEKQTIREPQVALRKDSIDSLLPVEAESYLNALSEPTVSRAPSMQSNASTLSTDSSNSVATVIKTTALIHPQPERQSLQSSQNLSSEQLLQPNETLEVKVNQPAEMPPLIVCEPNASSLFKMASNPQSPVSPKKEFPPSPATPPSVDEVDNRKNFIEDFLASCVKLSLPHQKTVEEEPCLRLDIKDKPNDKSYLNTGYKEVTTDQIRRCDGLEVESPIHEKPCSQIDINDLPKDKQPPATSFKIVELPTEKSFQQKNLYSANSPSSSSKPSTPILEARAAHSKALIDTCERIIAEEKEASNQMKSCIPTTSPKQTPKMQNKSKIPKPISCCSGSGSVSKAEYENLKYALAEPSPPSPSPASAPSPEEDKSEGPLIARMHVVETEIKVTTTTPPATPKASRKNPSPTQSPTSPSQPRKTKNIFDFIRKNFGHSNSAPITNETTTNESANPSSNPKDSVKYNQIIKVDNSKFYVPVVDSQQEDDLGPPPPLPKTPIPVNIELTKTFRTDEIRDESNNEMNFKKEISDMLDEEMDKLNQNSPYNTIEEKKN